jgi:hypothetical protein
VPSFDRREIFATFAKLMVSRCGGLEQVGASVRTTTPSALRLCCQLQLASRKLFHCSIDQVHLLNEPISYLRSGSSKRPRFEILKPLIARECRRDLSAAPPGEGKVKMLLVSRIVTGKWDLHDELMNVSLAEESLALEVLDGLVGVIRVDERR